MTQKQKNQISMMMTRCHKQYFQDKSRPSFKTFVQEISSKVEIQISKSFEEFQQASNQHQEFGKRLLHCNEKLNMKTRKFKNST